MEQERLTNKEKRRVRQTNKQRWANRKNGNKAKRRAFRELLAQKKV